MRANAAVICGLLAQSWAGPVSRSVIHEKHDASTARWIKRDALLADTHIPVRIALKQQNLHKGMDYLLEVSHPESASYGKHYTPQQVVELFAPADDSIKTVRDWLVSSGITAKSIVIPKSKAWIAFDTTAGQLEKVLKTKYHSYDHAKTSIAHVGTDEYSLPEEISALVEFITPGVVFARDGRVQLEQKATRRSKESQLKHKKPIVPMSKAEQLANCGSSVTPECIKAMYNIPTTTLANDNNKMGFYELDSKYAQKDLNDFFARYASYIPKGTHPQPAFINNATAPASIRNEGGEAQLDFEAAYPILWPQNTVLYQIEEKGIFNVFLDAIDGTYCSYTAYGETGDDPELDGVTPNEQCGVYQPANIISFSYGYAEVDLPQRYQLRQCDEFMKLSLQGVTLFFASGDTGVADPKSDCEGPKKNIFLPDSASSCPYVTSVGATTLPKGSSPGDNETASTQFSSGGGFSNFHTRPSYQDQTIKSYFASHNPGYANYTTSNGTIPYTGGIYNSAGRGYPDLSAVGQNGQMLLYGDDLPEGSGTSMSTPIVGAIFNRVNEERLHIGKAPIGFINPTLYAHPEMFNDIIVGDQALGGPGPLGPIEPSACGNNGFSAVPGWDPVTGLGTPNYQKVLEVFLALP